MYYQLETFRFDKTGGCEHRVANINKYTGIFHFDIFFTLSAMNLSLLLLEWKYMK